MVAICSLLQVPKRKRDHHDLQSSSLLVHMVDIFQVNLKFPHAQMFRLLSIFRWILDSLVQCNSLPKSALEFDLVNISWTCLPSADRSELIQKSSQRNLPTIYHNCLVIMAFTLEKGNFASEPTSTWRDLNPVSSCLLLERPHQHFFWKECSSSSG